MSIADNVARLRARMAAAAARAGRDPAGVRLLAVTKTVDDGRIREAIAAGVALFGENYVQEAKRKIEILGTPPAWHFIGHLQTNKAKYAVRLFDLIHSVDRLELARELDRRAAQAGRILPVLVEVNVSGEETKRGVSVAGALALLREMAALPNLAVRGLMTMPPWFADAEEARPFFRTLRELRDTVNREGISGILMAELSMGMSDDFEVAIEEGATIVRLGRSLFGERRGRPAAPGEAESP